MKPPLGPCSRRNITPFSPHECDVPAPATASEKRKSMDVRIEWPDWYFQVWAPNLRSPMGDLGEVHPSRARRPGGEE